MEKIIIVLISEDSGVFRKILQKEFQGMSKYWLSKSHLLYRETSEE
jgi:hypothetical protein